MSRVHAQFEKYSHGIICACDLDRLEDVTRLVEAIDPVEGLLGYKLGSLLSLRYGLAAAMKAFRKMTAKVLLYDHQKAGLDVPSMAAEYVGVCREAGADALILFPLGGPTVLEAFVAGTLEAGLLPIVGGALPLKDYLVKGGGYVAGGALARISRRAWELGARDFIIPATDRATVRAHVRSFASKGPIRLFMPGIGPLGGDIKGAFAAARGVSAYAIIGRAIYADPQPGEAARRLASEALAFTGQGRGGFHGSQVEV